MESPTESLLTDHIQHLYAIAIKKPPHFQAHLLLLSSTAKKLALFEFAKKQWIITLNNSEYLLYLTPNKQNLGFK